MPESKHPCPSSCQDASEAFLKLRNKCDEVEVLALEAMTAMRIGKTEMMGIEPRVMSAATGEGEEMIYQLAAVPGLARHMHYFFSEFMRKYNFELPKPPAYGHDDRPETVAVKIKTPRRR